MYKKTLFTLISTAAIAGCLPEEVVTTPATSTDPTWYLDNDNDGWGRGGATTAETQPSGYAANNADCDDTTGSIGPDQPEVADDVDNNCDGQIDEGFNYVFVTSTTYDAALGTLEEGGGALNADELCQERADAGTIHEGIYKAWITDLSTDHEISDRYTLDPGDNAFVEWEGGLKSNVVTLADNFADFKSMTLGSNIDHDEFGEDASGQTPWTNLNEDGSQAESLFDDTCLSFAWDQPGAQTAVVGDTDDATDWSNNGVPSQCDQPHPLICVQQNDAQAISSPGGGEYVDATPNEKIIFMSSTLHTGDFTEVGTYPDGLTGADTLCVNLAENATPALEGDFKAILSTSSFDAKDRLTNHAPGVLIKRTDGATVANGLADLWDANINVPINLDESGNPDIHFITQTWTGTDFDGTVYFSNHCNDWGTSFPPISGSSGYIDSSTAPWINDFGTPSCGQALHFYCIEQ